MAFQPDVHTDRGHCEVLRDLEQQFPQYHCRHLSRRAESKTDDADEASSPGAEVEGHTQLTGKGGNLVAMHMQPVQDRIKCHLPFKPWQDRKETDTTMGHKGTS